MERGGWEGGSGGHWRGDNMWGRRRGSALWGGDGNGGRYDLKGWRKFLGRGRDGGRTGKYNSCKKVKKRVSKKDGFG